MKVKMIERQRQLAGSDPKDDGLDERYNYFIEFGKKERWDHPRGPLFGATR